MHYFFGCVLLSLPILEKVFLFCQCSLMEVIGLPLFLGKCMMTLSIKQIKQKYQPNCRQ
jgi:hypothetical protein